MDNFNNEIPQMPESNQPNNFEQNQAMSDSQMISNFNQPENSVQPQMNGNYQPQMNQYQYNNQSNRSQMNNGYQSNGYQNQPNYNQSSYQSNQNYQQNNYQNNGYQQNSYSPASPSFRGGNSGEENINFKTYIIWSIVELVCCNQLFGILGLVFAILGKNALGTGNYDEAVKNKDLSKKMLIIGVIISGVLLVLYFILMLIGVAANSRF